jgi:hypothetical protein
MPRPTLCWARPRCANFWEEQVYVKADAYGRPLHHLSLKVIYSCIHETFPHYLGISCCQLPRRLSDWPPAFIRLYLNLTFSIPHKHFISAAKSQNGVGQTALDKGLLNAVANSCIACVTLTVTLSTRVHVLNVLWRWYRYCCMTSRQYINSHRVRRNILFPHCAQIFYTTLIIFPRRHGEYIYSFIPP